MILITERVVYLDPWRKFSRMRSLLGIARYVGFMVDAEPASLPKRLVRSHVEVTADQLRSVEP